MGRAKEKMMEFESKGYLKPPDKFVCSNHFDDYAILDFIKEFSEEGICSYCKLKYQKGKVVPLDILISFINEGIRSFYGDPNDEGVGWDSSEGGWQGTTVLDAYDLLRDEISLEVDEEKLFQDILHSFNDCEWCQLDPYALTESRELIYDWNNFSKLLKHKIRYVFFRTTEFDPKNEYKKAYEILDEVGKRIEGLNLIKEIDKGQTFFRARQHMKIDEVKSISQIASPPDANANISNRMSPAGISMFYGAYDPATAIEETIERSRKGEFISVAEFQNKNNLQLIDLTDLPEIPSIFDKKGRKNYFPIIFLRAFVADLSKKVARDRIEHIEYVPTQVVTEYFRYVFPELSFHQIDGLVYPSSKTEKGKCVVLFFDNKECIENFSMNSLTLKTEII